MPATTKDPLAIPQLPDRVHYATGALLGAEDFLDEQSYHRGRLARALSALFGSGTAQGLKVEWMDPAVTGKPEEIHVTPGLAIDRLGRMIEVTSITCIRLGKWYDGIAPAELKKAVHDGAVVVDVFARFVPCDRGKTPSFASTTYDSLNAVSPSRVRDGVKIELVPAERLGVPEPAWKNLPAAGDADFRTKLHEAILNAGASFRSEVDKDGLKPLPEHQTGQDTTDLLLARVSIPADDAGEGRPTRRNEPVTVNNDLRAYVYAPSLLALLAGA